MSDQQETIPPSGEMTIKRHALLEDFLLHFPCWQEAAQRAFTVHQDLTEVQHWWSCQLCFCEELDRPFITGRPSRHASTQAVLPLLSEEQLTVDDIQAFFTHITIDGERVIELTLAVLDLDSTLVYYKMTSGLCGPDAPEVVTQRRAEKQADWNRKRQHLAACVRRAMDRWNNHDPNTG